MFRKELQVRVMDRGGCVVTLMRQVWVGVDQRGNSSSAGQVPSDIDNVSAGIFRFKAVSAY